MKVSADAEAAPAAKNWNQAIRKYAADPTAAQTLDDLATLGAAKVHAVRSATYSDTYVKAATAREVTLQSCSDSSKASLEDAAGKAVELQPSSYPRTLLTFNVYLYAAKDGGWLVRETVVPNPVKTC